MDSELRYLHRLLSEKTNIIKMLQEDVLFLQSQLNIQNNILLKISASPEGCFEDVKDVKKSVNELRSAVEDVKEVKKSVNEMTSAVEDVKEVKESVNELTSAVDDVKKSVNELTNGVDDKLKGMTDMIQEMRIELNDIKKNQNKNAQRSVEDLYELGNDPDYNAALDYNRSSNLGNVQSKLNSILNSMYPHYQPPRLPQGPQTSQGLLIAKKSLKPTLPNTAPAAYGPSRPLGQSLSIVGPSAISTVTSSNAPPVNVVITSSDPSPSVNTTTTQPVLSVTIPSQHTKGNIQAAVTTPVPPTTMTPLAHNYQIPLPANKMVTTMPSVLSEPPPLISTQSLLSNVPSPAYSAIAKSQSPSRNVSLGIQIERTLDKTFSPDKTNRSNVSGTSIDQYDPRPDFQPIIPLPDEVPVNTELSTSILGEERETELFCQRAKLFRLAVTNDAREWKERGVGINIKILFNPETGKVRVIMRREQVHKICANHFITKDTLLTPMANNDRVYIWAAHDYADGEIVIEKFCVRFKTAEEARKFADVFELAKTKISDMPSINKSTETRKEPTSDFKIEALKPETPKMAATLTPVAQTNLGGFKFTSTPTFKPTEVFTTTPKVEEVKPKEKEPTYASPFAGFTFAKTTATPKHGLDSMDSQITTHTSSPQTNDHDDAPAEEFIPTAEFKPVVEKIPDLIEVKTAKFLLTRIKNIQEKKMVTTLPAVRSLPPPFVSTQSLLSNVPSPAYSAIAKSQSPSRNVSSGNASKNTTNIFGTAETNLFGTTPSTTSATNLFQSPSATSTGSGSNIFGSTTGSGSSSNSSIFGSVGGSSTGSIFGGEAQSQTNLFASTHGNIFGASKPAGNVFGSKIEPKVTDVNLTFGSSTITNLTESDEPVLKVDSDLSLIVLSP